MSRIPTLDGVVLGEEPRRLQAPRRPHRPGPVGVSHPLAMVPSTDRGAWCRSQLEPHVRGRAPCSHPSRPPPCSAPAATPSPSRSTSAPACPGYHIVGLPDAACRESARSGPCRGHEQRAALADDVHHGQPRAVGTSQDRRRPRPGHRRRRARRLGSSSRRRPSPGSGSSASSASTARCAVSRGRADGRRARRRLAAVVPVVVEPPRRTSPRPVRVRVASTLAEVVDVPHRRRRRGPS